MNKAINKRVSLIEAAAELLTEGGLQIPVSAITQRAGVAHGTMYVYFKSKQELIQAVYDVIGQQHSALILEDSDFPDLRLRIDQMVSDYAGFIWDNDQRAMLLEYLVSSPAFAKIERQPSFSPYYGYWMRTLQEAQKRGIIRQYPAGFLGSFTRGAIRNILRRFRTVGHELTPEDNMEIRSMCWAALRVSGGDALAADIQD